MVAIPETENTIVKMIDAHHERRPERPRPHMGISMIGHPCERYMWLSFRWAVQEKFSGRMLRLFRRGHREEETIIQDLKAIGVDFAKTQAHVDFGSHVSGSADGIIESGVPGAEKTRHIAEFKTHSLKSFNALVMGGVQKSKPIHWAQMQGYMHGAHINRALYVAVCKDDDRIYTERIQYDREAAEKLVKRAQRIALDDRMPPPISTDPSWYQCRFCPAYAMCHEGEPTKHVNCRTCAHAEPMADSAWRCMRHEGQEIPVEFQHEGCDDHMLHNDVVPWKMKPSKLVFTAVYVIDGKPVENGSNGFKSREILANPEGCANETVREIKTTWPGAEVVR